MYKRKWSLNKWLEFTVYFKYDENPRKLMGFPLKWTF